MAIPKETEDYIRESIEDSVGLPISERTLKLKLLASEEDRRQLRDHNFILQDRLREFHMRLHSYKEEASMNAQGLKKCIQEREKIVAKYTKMEKCSAKLKRECMLFERDLETAMESCDDYEKENNKFRAQLEDISSLQAISVEVQSLREDKEMLLKNLQRAEEEVKFLHKDNRSLDEENKQLRKLNRERKHHRSEHKNSARGSSRGKRKSRYREGSPFAREAGFDRDEQSRHCPLSPLKQISPQSKRLKR